MTSYLKSHYNPVITSQSQPLPGCEADQVENDAGGYVFRADDWKRLERFLILGTEGGSYYVGERKLTAESARLVRGLIAVDAPRVTRTAVEISVSGRAPNNDPALFVLALVASYGNNNERAFALANLSKVARTGTHLFTFLDFVQQHRGWGRGLRTAVANWYLAKPADKLAYQLIKYRQRGGWTHRDVLRLAHPDPRLGGQGAQAAALSWAAGKPSSLHLPYAIEGFEQAQRSKSPQETARLISTFGLPREALLTEHLNDPDVWRALLHEGMPQTALMRNLATMTRVGVLEPFSSEAHLVAQQLVDPQRLRAARVHPFNVLVALKTYAQGHGERGRNIWTPNQLIVDALDAAFYASFQHVEGTGKRTMLALDVSGSMDFNTISSTAAVTAREASAAMAMVTAAVDPHMFVAFSTELVGVSLSPRQRLDDITRQLKQLPFGGTDIAQPMLAATRQGLEIDTFVIYTDNETWAGRVHPTQALRQYRQHSGILAKMIVVAMSANRYSVADPNDFNSMDVVGFDASAPQIIADFSRA